MTYKEAQEIIDRDWKKLTPQMVNSIPPHLILRTLIAPIGSDLNTLVQIDSFLTNDHVPNDEVLLQMNLFGNNLEPFIVYLMSGSNIIWPLRAYFDTGWRVEGDSGNEV